MEDKKQEKKVDDKDANFEDEQKAAQIILKKLQERKMQQNRT